MVDIVKKDGREGVADKVDVVTTGTSDSFALTAEKKFAQLKSILKSYRSLGIACSGGVDSTLLLWAAIESLGIERVTGVYLISELQTEESVSATLALIRQCFPERLDFKVRRVCSLEWSEFVINSSDRCYICKKKMYSLIRDILGKKDIEVLADGTNYDDLGEDRPGLAAIKELDVVTPLAKAFLEKKEIRFLARQCGLKNWNLPSNSCFATRIMDGQPIKKETLVQVECAEEFLKSLGFLGVRVRFYVAHVVIEVEEEDINRIVHPAIRLQLLDFFSNQGVESVSLKLQGR